MNNTAVICKIKNVRPHPNADKVQLGTACGYQVVIGLEIEEGDFGIYFPTDTCLGKDFAEENPGLLTYFGKNLRVRTQSFRGEKSEGFWCHIQHLPVEAFEASTKEGTELTVVNGKEICKKYINPETLKFRNRYNSAPKRLRSGLLPTFQKHVETSHLRREWETLDKRSKKMIWTEKVHGTSQRVGNVLVPVELNRWQKLLKKLGIQIQESRYEYLVGSRNVILGELKADGTKGKDGFYSDEFRVEASKPFLGNLHKGEVVYYEVVGYAAFNSPIMSVQHPSSNDIKKLYGKDITYTYGCANGSHDIYVYRIAYQTEEGESIDLTWDQVKARCGELGVKHVPEVDHLNFTSKYADIEYIAEFINQASPIDSRHPMEGVVLRLDSSKPEFYKEKSFIFKVLEGIAKDTGAVDLEEAS